jgi:hypothetical protein
VAILLATFVVRLWLFTGYRNGDVGNYVQEGYAWSIGEYSLQQVIQQPGNGEISNLYPGPKFNWQNLRLGMILPTAAAYQLFGVGDLANVMLMFCCVALAVGVAYRFGRDAFSNPIGIAAAVFAAFIPFEISLSTTLVPHLPTAAITALAAYAFWRSFESNGGGRFKWGVLSGFSIAVAYAVWEFSILMVGVFGLYWILRWIVAERGQRSSIFMISIALGCGFVPLFALETIYFYQLTGIPFFRQAFISELSPLWLELHPADRALLAFDRFPRAITASYYFGTFYYFALVGIVAAVAALFAKRRSAGSAWLRSPLILLLGWFAFLAGYLQFGTSSFSHYQPVYKLNHYLSVVTIPASLLAAFGLVRLSERLPAKLRSAFVGVALIGFATTSSVCAWVNHVGNGPYRSDVTHELEMTKALDEIDPDLPIYTDDWTKDGLDYAYRYQREVIGITSIANLPNPPIDPTTIESGLLLLNWRYLAGEHTMSTHLPDWMLAPPPNWELAQRIGAPGAGVAIYRAVKRP